MEYTDGFFDVSEKHGFLPIHDPRVSLPMTYLHLQQLMSDLPFIIKKSNEIVERVKQIPDYSKDIENETDVFIIQALFRAYTFTTSAYTLEASYQEFIVSGTYGKARRVLPSNISKPLVLVSEKLGVYPWLDYHYAYSLGNYVRKDRSDGLDWKNLEMACSFTDSPDEVGFIMLHVYINELSPALVECVMKYKESGIHNGNLQQKDSRYLQTCAQVMKQINGRRREMWEASRHEKYNDFRVFIMGIKGNTELFGDGLVYEGCFNDVPQQFRGQTGAQDNIIPMMDIFTGIVDYYPENELTSYLLDLRTYRPECIQRFFTDLRRHYEYRPLFLELEKMEDIDGLISLLEIVDEVYFFRNGHWQFVQKYIMANTNYPVATGGTPIISWLINQIDAVLMYELKLISAIERLCTEHNNNNEYKKIKDTWQNKKDMLLEHIEELKKKDYQVELIYSKNKERCLNDDK